LSDLLQHYDGSNHILYTWIAKLVRRAFRWSDWSVRLPALLASALYLWAAYRVARSRFGDGWLFLAALALLVLNPLVVDCLSAANGHGMALAFWMAALGLLLEGRRLELAGVALGLAVAADLAFTFPAAALAAGFALTDREWRGEAVRRLAIPAVVTAFILVALPIAHVDSRSFSADAGPPFRGARLLVIPLALAAIAIADSQLARLTGITMAICLVLLGAAKRWLHLPYPAGGAQVYWIPLITLAAFELADRLRWRKAAPAMAAVVAGFYLWGFPIRPEDGGVRFLVKAVRQEAPRQFIRVGASASIEPIVEFYKQRYGLGYWHVLEGESWTEPFDYYFLAPEDAALAEKRHLYVVARNSGVVAAR
jgi:hypothetical protein